MRNYIGMAYQFFNLTREAINEMEKQGNPSLIFSSLEYDEDKAWKNYDEKTKWNDFNIGIPILFNFYHGLELFMKGLLLEMNPKEKITNHKLTDLKAKLNNFIPEIPESIVEIIHIHLSNQSPFYQFFKSNNLTFDNFYELLKYPESKKGQEFFFGEIRGKEKVGLENFKEIRKSTIDLKEEVMKWNNSKIRRS